MPEHLKDKPEMQFGLQVFYKAFWELCTCRVSGMGEGHIPWHIIKEYAIYLGYRGHDIGRFTYIIRKMDVSYLEQRNKKDGGKS